MNKLIFSSVSISISGLTGTAIYYREPLFETVDFSSDKYQNNVLVSDEFLNTRVSSKSVFSQEEQERQTRKWEWTEGNVKKTLKITNVPDFWSSNKGERISAFSVTFKEDSDTQILLIAKIHQTSSKDKKLSLTSCWFAYREILSTSKFLTIPKFENNKSSGEFKLENDKVKSKQEALSDFYKNYFSSNSGTETKISGVDCSSKKQSENITIT